MLKQRMVFLNTVYYAPSALTLWMVIPVWLSGHPLLGGVLAVIALSSFLITRRLMSDVARADQQKKCLDEQLVQSQKLASIGELSSGLAHEINNPIAIISQEIDWIRHLVSAPAFTGAEGIGELTDSLDEIARQVARCKDITHKLLDFARKSEPLVQRVDINKLIEDMAKLVEREAVQNGIEIKRHYLSDLPKVPTDAPLLRQVVLNMLNNASYAVEKGGTITVTTWVADDENIGIAIEDTGCGIPKEHLGKIFDPFFTTKPPGKGTGLGLSICHNIVARLGGRITVESEPGKGTTFTVYLPMKR